MRKTTVVIALASALKCQTASGQARRPSLVELARTQGDIERVARACGYVGAPPTLNGLIQSTDVILYGTVVAADGRLPDDLDEVWTDYRVEPFEALQ